MKTIQKLLVVFLILGFTACSTTYKEAQMYPLSSVDNKPKSSFEISGEMTLFVEKSF